MFFSIILGLILLSRIVVFGDAKNFMRKYSFLPWYVFCFVFSVITQKASRDKSCQSSLSSTLEVYHETSFKCFLDEQHGSLPSSSRGWQFVVR